MAEAQNSELARALEFKIETSRGSITIQRLFEKFFGRQITPDPSPIEIRERLLFLGAMYHQAMYEKSLSQVAYGRHQVSLWNNIVSVLDKEIKLTESINMSICNERRVINART